MAPKREPVLSELPIPPASSNPPRTFRIPADYYAASPDEVRPLFPRWVTFGCGAAAAVFLLLGFAGGAVIAHNGLGPLMDPLLGSMQGELDGMYAKDVTPIERKALDGELTALRANVRTGKVSMTDLNPLLQLMRDDVSDEKLTRQEASTLAAKIHAVNNPATPRPAATH